MSVDGAVKAFEALDGTDAVPLLEPQTKERCRVNGDDVRLMLRWGLPRKGHPLYDQMMAVQERRRKRRERAKSSSLAPAG